MSLFAPLWTMVDVRPSSIDKKSVEGQPAVRLCNYTDVYTNRDIDSGLDLMEATASTSQLARLRVLPRDVLITKDSESPDDIGVPAFVRSADPHMVCGYHLSLLRPGGDVEGRFLYWYLCSEAAQEYWLTHSFGVTRYSLTLPTVWGLPIPVITLDKQSRIARYLDHEVAEIDAVDADLDRLIEKLVERRLVEASALHRRGFEQRRLKWLMREVDDRAGATADALPLLSVSIHSGVRLRDETTTNQAASADLGHYKVARRGQVVLNRMRAFQGGLGVAPVDGLVSPDYSVLEVNSSQLTPEWAEYVMRSPDFVDAMSAAVRGIGSSDQGNVRTPRINVRDLFDLSMPLPSLDEQHNVVADLDAATARINAMIADAQRLKELLAERRTTLITEVVTGRKEVPA